jgi:hypothetical protein
MSNVNTLKTMQEAREQKEDRWGFALNKFSKNTSEMEDGDRYYKVPSGETLGQYVRRFPNAKSVSLEEINTPTKTQRILYLHDNKYRVIHSTQNLEVSDEEIYVSLPRARSTCFGWMMQKLFAPRLHTRNELKFKFKMKFSPSLF